jgi:molecular chaperone GrpE (heat shock protein)
VGSIERRIEALEKSFGTKAGEAEEISEKRKRLIEELKARRPEFEERMAREEAEGDFRRRRALEELEESIKRRMRTSEAEDGF